MGIFERVLFGFIAICCVFMAGVILLVTVEVYRSYTSEKLVLQKAEWVCTAEREERVLTMAGKVPVYMNKTVCTQYSKK